MHEDAEYFEGVRLTRDQMTDREKLLLLRSCLHPYLLRAQATVAFLQSASLEQVSASDYEQFIRTLKESVEGIWLAVDAFTGTDKIN